MLKPFMVFYFCLHIRTLSYSDNLWCPDDTFFNQTTQICTECGVGYHGPKCILACRYPNYGRGCQEKCHCEEKNCNHVTGCFINEDDPKSFDQPVAITISVMIGILLVIAAFILIMKAKRQFFSSITRGNAHYVGSLVAEHCVSMHNYEQTQLECNTKPDNDIYMLASSMEYKNVRDE